MLRLGLSPADGHPFYEVGLKKWIKAEDLKAGSKLHLRAAVNGGVQYTALPRPDSSSTTSASRPTTPSYAGGGYTGP